MIKGRDIIVVGIQAWDIEIGSNCKNIAIEMAKNNRVLYVNPPLDRITRLKEKDTERVKKRIHVKNGTENDLERLSDTMWTLYPKTITESINFIASERLFDWLNKRNAKHFASDIRSAAKRLGFHDFILFNDSSMFLGLHLKELLKPSVYVYYMRDYLIRVPYWKRHGERIEPQLIAKADVVVNNSVLYAEYGQKYNSNSFMVGQGCDVSLFNDEDGMIDTAPEFEGIRRPIMGYVGYLTEMRLDIPLLVHLAQTRPDWSLVLVGPEDVAFRNSELHQLENVHFLGSRNPEDLPSYVKGFDVALNPQLVNDWTIGNYPRKIDEYLAMGKPVVATHTRAMDMFEDHVYLGKSKEEYQELTERALSEDTAALQRSRIEFAKGHTWENNVRAIYEAMLKTTLHVV